MTSRKLSLLALAIAAAAFAGACNRSNKADTTAYENKPAETTPAETPATTTPPPVTTPADTTGTSTASTGDMNGTKPTSTLPAPTSATPATTANAATPFDDMDLNNDGNLSRDELPQTSPLLQNFSTADKDGNGMLSRAEVDAQRGKMPPGG